MTDMQPVNEFELSFKLTCPVCNGTYFIDGIYLNTILYTPLYCELCGKSKVMISEHGIVSLEEIT